MFIGHGDDAYLFENIRFNFSSNVWHQGPPVALARHIKKNILNIKHYPPPQDNALIKKIADFHSLTPQNFFLSAGSTEAIYLIAQLFRGDRALILEPTFSEYHDACKQQGIQVQSFALPSFCQKSNKEKWQKALQKTLKKNHFSLLFFCNPNNPSGEYFLAEEFLDLSRKFPHTLFVIDEAYFDFCFAAQKKSFLEYIKDFKNLIVLKSLTKNFSLSGLRLSYLAADKKIIQKLSKYHWPWAVNSPALAAAHWIFDNNYPLPFRLKQLEKQTNNFQKMLNAIKFVQCLPTTTNYFLIRLQDTSAKELKKYLITKHAILLRDASNFKLLAKNHVRVSLQNRQAQSALQKALQDFSADPKNHE